MNTSCEDVNIARGKTITCLESSPRAKVMARDFLVHVFLAAHIKLNKRQPIINSCDINCSKQNQEQLQHAARRWYFCRYCFYCYYSCCIGCHCCCSWSFCRYSCLDAFIKPTYCGLLLFILRPSMLQAAKLWHLISTLYIRFFRECTDTKNKLRYAASSSAKGNYALGMFR